MPGNVEVSVDRFAVAFGSILDEVGSGIDEALLPAVKRGCKVARDTTRANVAASGITSVHGYDREITYKTDKSDMIASGVVGNKVRPGLPHLLEKGHAKVGGGRTRAFEHFAPGADAGARAFEERLMQEVGNALR